MVIAREHLGGGGAGQGTVDLVNQTVDEIAHAT